MGVQCTQTQGKCYNSAAECATTVFIISEERPSLCLPCNHKVELDDELSWHTSRMEKKSRERGRGDELTSYKTAFENNILWFISKCWSRCLTPAKHSFSRAIFQVCIHQSLWSTLHFDWKRKSSRAKIILFALRVMPVQWHKHLLSLLNEHKGCVRIVSTPFQLPLCCANTINRECLIPPSDKCNKLNSLRHCYLHLNLLS
jgi:hypothetical protein